MMVRSRRAKRPCPDGHRRRDDPRARGRNPRLASLPHQQRPAGSHELARPGGEGSGRGDRTTENFITMAYLVCGKLSFNLPT